MVSRSAEVLTAGLAQSSATQPGCAELTTGAERTLAGVLADVMCYLTERTLTIIGDDCVLNVNTKIQCHSQEDGTFKSDRTTLGAGCAVGAGAMVGYGVRMGDGLRAGRRLLPEERRGHARARTVGRQPGQGDVT